MTNGTEYNEYGEDSSVWLPVSVESCTGGKSGKVADDTTGAATYEGGKDEMTDGVSDEMTEGNDVADCRQDELMVEELTEEADEVAGACGGADSRVLVVGATGRRETNFRLPGSM
ncbi:uncharacterized protein LOC134247322 [Saccostrea cucullata]|uniref:uncharacterized protein LOC134247322 n=1 Tax=Saccostrea cuccullata TaxID=36930 RepID=UPI002ED4A23C